MTETFFVFIKNPGNFAVREVLMYSLQTIQSFDDKRVLQMTTEDKLDNFNLSKAFWKLH